MSQAVIAPPLEWVHDRWHCDGRGMKLCVVAVQNPDSLREARPRRLRWPREG
ncbi:MAG: hypothetical protein ACLQLG_08880 [Thermoguttaceae bacterium]